MIISVFTDEKNPVLLGIDELGGVERSDGATYFADGILHVGKGDMLIPVGEGRAVFATLRCTVSMKGNPVKAVIFLSEATEEEIKTVTRIKSKNCDNI